MNRKLDGCYFRVKRDGEWENICFTDLTDEERDKVLDGRSEKWLRSLCKHLTHVIQGIGEEFDLRGE